MARSISRSAGTERAYLQFAPQQQRGIVGAVAATPAGEEFDESDIWGAFSPAPAPAPAEQPRQMAPHRPVVPAARKANKAAAQHGSLPVNIPDWSKILGEEYCRGGQNHGDWDPDDGDDDDVGDTGGGAAVMVPPHELAWRRRAASLSVHEHEGAGVLGRTLKVRDAVWKRTTGFQD